MAGSSSYARQVMAGGTVTSFLTKLERQIKKCLNLSTNDSKHILMLALYGFYDRT